VSLNASLLFDTGKNFFHRLYYIFLHLNWFFVHLLISFVGFSQRFVKPRHFLFVNAEYLKNLVMEELRES